jgi:uncharacterized protein YegJ (DUF2314 family)
VEDIWLENTWPVAFADEEMNAAIALARASLGEFLSALLNPTPTQKSFLLKVRFEQESTVEHIWIADLDLSQLPSSGVVAVETNFPGLKFMQATTFMPDQISDWMFYDGDEIVGGYTTRLLQQRAKPQ